MTIRLNGSTSGYTEIDAPAVAGNNTLLLPTANGTNGQLLTTSGGGQLTFSNKTNYSGAVSFTLSTTISYTGIPSTATRIRQVGLDLSNGGAASGFLGVRVGNSGGYLTTGYNGGTVRLGTSGAAAITESSYLRITENVPGAADTYSFILDWELVDSSTGLWTVTGMSFVPAAGAAWANIVGHVTVSGSLDRIQFRSAVGNFDAGTMYVTWD